MKNNILGCFILFLFVLCSRAQNYKWAQSFEGAGGFVGVDASNNIYVSGIFENTVDFDPGPGTYTLQANFSSDIFLCKYTSAGNFVWAQKLGSNGLDLSYDMAVNKTGICLVSNYAYSFARYNSQGGLLWHKSLTALPCSVALDTLGNAYIAGVFSYTTNFDPGVTNFSMVAKGSSDFFVLKMGINGLIDWIVQLDEEPGVGWPKGISVIVDPQQNVIVSGGFSDTLDVDPGPSVVNLIASTYSDVFLIKLDPNSNLIWSTQFGFPCFNYGGRSVVTDKSGNIYTGLQSDSDVVISKFLPSGQIQWHRTFGGQGVDGVCSISVDKNKSVYTSGYFNQTVDFDPGQGTYVLSSFNNTHNDAFISGLDSMGNFQCAARIGNQLDDGHTSITVDNVGDLVLTGSFADNIDLDPGTGAETFTSVPKGNSAYLLKLQSCSFPFITDIQSQKTLSEVVISPNPSEGNILIKSEELIQEINVFDQLGRLCFHENSNATILEINLSGLDKGWYNLILEGEEVKVAKKVLLR